MDAPVGNALLSSTKELNKWMSNNIKYLTDAFLEDFKLSFKSNYLALYKTNNKAEMKGIFSNPENVLESSTVFDYIPLKQEYFGIV